MNRGRNLRVVLISRDKRAPESDIESMAIRLQILLLLSASSIGCGTVPAKITGTSIPVERELRSRWEAFDEVLHETRERGCPSAADVLDDQLARIDSVAATLISGSAAPEDQRLDLLTAEYLAAAPLVSVCRDRLQDLQRAHARASAAIRSVSRSWDFSNATTADRLFFLLDGLRAARDQAVLLGPPADAEPVVVGPAALNPSVPSGGWAGIQVQSGDLLLSRGTVASSALTSRGNDRPGVFSHVALLHIDPTTTELTFVEAFPETGAVGHDSEFYRNDPKRRLLVLRPRPDLRTVMADPSFAHRAANAGLALVSDRVVKFDFALDAGERKTMFCSEIPLYAYGDLGLRLWDPPSVITTPGKVNWLYSLGARHFETQVPNDLELEPDLEVVGEWAEPSGLWSDLLDNVASDALFESADRGENLRTPAWLMPVALGMKAWSWTLNRFGREGPLPRGAKPLQALRFRDFAARHADLVEYLVAESASYESRHGHRPFYPDLLAMARRRLLE